MNSNNCSMTSFDWRDLPRPFSVLAPMIDVTDTCFRRLIKEWSAPDVLFSEFVSADTWCDKGLDSVSMRLKFDPEENPLIAQVWGKSPENYFTTVERLIEMGFAGVDIKMYVSNYPGASDQCGRLVRARSIKHARTLIETLLEEMSGESTII